MVSESEIFSDLAPVSKLHQDIEEFFTFIVVFQK